MSLLKKYWLILICFGSVFSTTEAFSIDINAKTYSKQYYSNGNLQSEGWKLAGEKIDYWKFYHPNGSIASKGHFNNNRKTGYWYFFDREDNLLREGHYSFGKAENWWIYYNYFDNSETRIQYQNNRKNGIALYYRKNKLVKAEKFRNDLKIGEWTSISSFRHDNPDTSFK